MAVNGVSSMKDFLAGFGASQKNSGGIGAGANKEPDIDKEENDKLTAKMYLAGTTSDAAAAYFGALQDAVKDSKNGFEANRRVNRLTSTHERIASSEEYSKKPEAKSIVKDFTDAAEEKKKETDEVVEKRKEKAAAEANKSADYNDTHSRISSIPHLGQYEELIARFLSGETEMESAGKPLTDDQIALRGFMREYMRTDKRSMSQIAVEMKQSNKNFLDYWMKNGNGSPMPGHMVSADGSFKIFNSKAEKDEYMNAQKMGFLKDVMSVIKAGKIGGVDVKV